jgi:hypothetical protein
VRRADSEDAPGGGDNVGLVFFHFYCPDLWAINVIEIM